MKKILSTAIIFLFSFPVFANTTIPTTKSDADLSITATRTKPYTVGTEQCKSDKIMLRAIAKDYYASIITPVEVWKSEIEKTRTLTNAEKTEYDYVKSVFAIEKNQPQYRTWYVCDNAMKVFKENIRKQKDDYHIATTKLAEEYKTAQIITGTDGIQTFISPTYNTTIAIINAKDIRKYQNELANYEYVIKVKSTSSISVMMKNNVVNKKMANFYWSPINSVSLLSFQKIYTAYTVSANRRNRDYGEASVYPKSTKVWKIYFIEM